MSPVISGWELAMRAIECLRDPESVAALAEERSCQDCREYREMMHAKLAEAAAAVAGLKQCCEEQRAKVKRLEHELDDAKRSRDDAIGRYVETQTDRWP